MPKVNKTKLTFKKHKEKWRDCEACDLCNHRKNIVLLRGTVPSPILFVGEAPGKSENVLGRPFVGPAGEVLDDIIDAAMLEPGTYAMTNLVACIPLIPAVLNEDSSYTSAHKVDEPPDYAIKECTPRLLEAIDLCKPKLLIAVGAVSEKWLPKILANTRYKKLPIAPIIHPAAILRMNISQKGLALQRAAIALADAVEGV